MNRREFVSGMAALGSAAVLDGIPRGQTASPAHASSTALAELALPRKADFAIPEGETYINCAYVHPMPIAGILAETLPYIRKLGIEKIQAHRQPFLKKLREGMPRLGFASITPPESTSALMSFKMQGKDRADVLRRLKKANVNVRVTEEFLRVSPSVFNDMGDIEKLLETLS